MENVGRKSATSPQARAGSTASRHFTSSVNIQRNSSQPASVNARSYAQGNNLHLGTGQAQQLPHEAWHVVQQRQGAVNSTAPSGGIGINSSPRLERQADAIGKRAAHGAAKKV